MKSIGLKNTKAFTNTGCIDIAPLTIFVGRNSCGKSSFIRFPAVLAQTFKSGIDSPISLHGQQENYIDYGNFEDVLHNHTGNCFTVVLEYRINIKDRSQKYQLFSRAYSLLYVDADLPDIAKIEITYSKPDKRSRVYATRIVFYINGELFSSFDKIEQTKRYIFTQKKTIQEGCLIDYDNQFEVSSSLIQNFMPSFDEEDIWSALCKQKLNITDERDVARLYREYVLPSKRYERLNKMPHKSERKVNIPESLPEEMQELVDAFNAFFVSGDLFGIVYDCMRREFMQLHYIGPFRSAPKRVYRSEEIERSDVGIAGDYTSSLLINDSQLVDIVSDWLRSALQYSIEIQEVGKNSGYYQIFATDVNGNPSNLIDVGYGISQVLPIVTQIAKTEQKRKKVSKARSSKAIAYPEIIIVEQPELHLHPAAQSELASLFVSTILQPIDQNRKILIETHSEHFIRALQVLIATPSSGLTKDMVKVYYVDKEDNGSSTIKEMKIDESGQFEEPWPSGFFDKAYELSKQLLRANAQRKYGRKEE